MSRVSKRSFPVWLWFGTALVLIAAALILGRSAGKEPSTLMVPIVLPDDWNIPQLIDHIEKQGLTLRPVASVRGLGADRDVYLTHTDLKFEQLDGLLKVPELIETWRGTVYCTRLIQPESREIQLPLWGSYCLCAGPFVFFGDPNILAEIRDGLSRGTSSGADIVASEDAE